MELEPKRAKRRRLTATVAKRRHSSYIHLLLCLTDLSKSRHASTSAHYWAKKGIAGCPCHKAHHGAPRRGKGMCDLGARNRIYRWRSLTRELQRLVLRQGSDLHGDEVAVLSHNGYVRDLW